MYLIWYHVFKLTWPCSLPSSLSDRSHPFLGNGLSSEENNHTVRGHSVIHLWEEKHNIRAQVLNWDYNILTFMSNYRLKTKGGCQTFLNPYLVPHIVFNLKLKKTINFDSKGQGNWFCIRAHVVVGTDRWMNCFERKEEGRGVESFSVFFEQMRLNRAINLTHMTCSLAAEPITGKQEKNCRTNILVGVKAQHAFPKIKVTKHNFMKSVIWSKASKPIVWGIFLCNCNFVIRDRKY